MTRTSTIREASEIQVETQGDLPPYIAEHARAKILPLLADLSEPVLYARIRLTRMRNPATERPAIAQASVDVNGRAARATVAAETMPEAVGLLRERLAGQLARLRRHWEARRGATPSPETGEWRHVSEPAHRPEHFPRPPSDREIIRHKTFALPVETPDEAAFELDLMDYDFHLFTDVETGEDSVLYRSGPTGYRMASLHPGRPRQGPVAVQLTESELPAPRLTTDEAKERLDLTGQPFVFYVDAETGRGNVMYHRYDGHYGLITPG